MLKKTLTTGRNRTLDNPAGTAKHYHTLYTASWVPAVGVRKPDMILGVIHNILNGGGTIEGVVKKSARFPEFIAHIPHTVKLPKGVEASQYMFGMPDGDHPVDERIVFVRMAPIVGLTNLLRIGVRVVGFGHTVLRGRKKVYYEIRCKPEQRKHWFGNEHYRILKSDNGHTD